LLLLPSLACCCSSLLRTAHTIRCQRAGVIWLALFCTLLMGLPVLAQLLPSHAVAMVDAFFRSGLLVFGGGHVVLPLLQAEVVPSG